MREEQIKTVEAFDTSADAYHKTIAQLPNYNESYDCFCKLLGVNDTVLDLGCGPGNISMYIKRALPNSQITGVDLSENMIAIAKKNIPDGNFFKDNAIQYKHEKPVNGILLGFILPFLTLPEIDTLLSNSEQNLVNNGYLFLSFMVGNREGFERPSFNNKTEIFVYYHDRTVIKKMVIDKGFQLVNEWSIDYKESDGSITKDIILIAKKENLSTKHS